jgi:hypothetical protein
MAAAMRQPWAKPNWVSTARAAVPHGHGVEQERALPGETDHAPLWIELQELPVMQIFHAHRPPHQIEGTLIHFD